MALTYFLEKGVDNDYLSVGTWELDDAPYAEPGETPDAFALNDNWRNLGQAIIDIHNALAFEELSAEPSGAGEVLQSKSGIWLKSGDKRLHFKDPNDVDQTIAFIDDINKLDPQESVIDFRDLTTNEPASPSVGDRYVNTVTGLSSVTGQSVTADYIYQWNGTDWTEIVPDQGTRLVDESTNNMMYYDGASWINLGSIISHNDTTGKQGGTATPSNQYYHLTQAQHTELTDWLDNVVLDTDGSIHLEDAGTVHFGSADDAYIKWVEGAANYLEILSNEGFYISDINDERAIWARESAGESIFDIYTSDGTNYNQMRIKTNQTTGQGTVEFNITQEDIDFIFNKGSAAVAFDYDSGDDAFSFNTEVFVLGNNPIYFGASENVEMFWNGTSSSFDILVGANTTSFSALGSFFNDDHGNVDFVIGKNVSGDAFYYDASADTIDINSSMFLPDNTSIYFGSSNDGEIYWNPTGALRIWATGVTTIANNDTTLDSFIAVWDDYVSIQHKNPLGSFSSYRVYGDGIYFNFNEADADWYVKKFGGGNAFVYDAGDDEFDINSDLYFADDKYIYFGAIPDAHIGWNNTAGDLEIISTGDLLLDDQYLTSALPLSQTGNAALDSWFTTAASIVGALNELATGKTSGVNADTYSWSDSGTTPYLSTTATTWNTMASFLFDGTTAAGNPQAIKVIANNQAATQTDIRVYDYTNSQVIATYTGLTAGVPTIIDMGTLSNLPAAQAILEVQLQTVGAGAGYLYALHVDY